MEVGPKWKEPTGIDIKVIEVPVAEMFTKIMQDFKSGAGANDALNVIPSWMPDIAMAGASLAPGQARVPVTIELVQPTGSRVQATMPLGGASIIAELAAHDVSRPGEKTEIDIDMTRAVIIDPQTEKVL
jgi:hypothetical protein